ncbi:Brp/Blh family beta-carotene 15,15'-dioxygenase [Thiocystis violacea]|uniref:Brp/Blh family beta-carotene 15,15'-dioxygenase n=1 Tax=Thiocystis violacea TaxID=13725 RepID=UPI0019037380|nr:Brp/Blh family beta-carotene 15,15'-dioxygenase [Thiocystis violacea]
MITSAILDREDPSRADKLQVASFLAMSAVAILLWGWLDARLPFALEMALAVVSVALLGIPHGALDFMHMKALAARLGRAELLWVGFVLYLLLGGLVIAAWIAFPAPMLAAFLAATVLHWGVEDTRAPLAWRSGYIAEVLLRGAMPIVLPLAFHPAQTAWLFGQLIPTEAALALTQGVGALWPLLLLLAASLLGGLFARRASLPRREWWTLIELATIAALFVVTPPLVAFAVYFGLLHSARYLTRYAMAGESARRSGAVRRALDHAWPMTLLTWVLALGAFALLSPERAGIQATLQVLFIGLAALTFPHALLVMSLRFVAPRDPDGQGAMDSP